MTTEQQHSLAEEAQVLDQVSSPDQSTSPQGTAEEHPEVEEVDYRSWDKDALLVAFKQYLSIENIAQALKQVGKVKTVIEEKIQDEKSAALEKFLAEGGIEGDFEYKGDSLITEIDKDFRNLKTKQKNFLNDLTRKKQENFQVRLSLLEKLRLLVDGQKGSSFKQIQEEWKKASPIPQEHNNELWASFNALADRYYDNKTIDFELKELDRKKNLEIKNEICAKAEALANDSSINKSLDTLNFLHREYKHIGPVPEDQKEPLWQRFKLASDALYARRDELLKSKQAEQVLNLEKKRDFLSKLEVLSQFQSETAEGWKQKITELDALQKEWAAIGFAGKDDEAKDVSKKYWEHVKTFYKNKNEHYKKVYDLLSENLKKKEELCVLAENLVSEEDLDLAGNTVIQLQKKWKEIGHVPFKVRDRIFDRFKKSCDDVFNRKRGIEKIKDSEFEGNLTLKLAICDQLTRLDQDAPDSVATFKRLLAEWKSIGFVPRKDINTIQTKYSEAVKKFLENNKQNEEEKRKIRLSMEMDDIRSKPDAKILLQKKESALKAKIRTLQSEIDTLNNNLLFFARSKNASALTKDVENKVHHLEKQISNLNIELQLIHSA